MQMRIVPVHADAGGGGWQCGVVEWADDAAAPRGAGLSLSLKRRPRARRRSLLTGAALPERDGRGGAPRAPKESTISLPPPGPPKITPVRA
jgi:hypothetical protein